VRVLPPSVFTQRRREHALNRLRGSASNARLPLCCPVLENTAVRAPSVRPIPRFGVGLSSPQTERSGLLRVLVELRRQRRLNLRCQSPAVDHGGRIAEAVRLAYSLFRSKPSPLIAGNRSRRFQFGVDRVPGEFRGRHPSASNAEHVADRPRLG